MDAGECEAVAPGRGQCVTCKQLIRSAVADQCRLSPVGRESSSLLLFSAASDTGEVNRSGGVGVAWDEHNTRVMHSWAYNTAS